MLTNFPWEVKFIEKKEKDKKEPLEISEYYFQ